MSAEAHCLVCVYRHDGTFNIFHWKGSGGAKRLKASIRRKYASDSSVARFDMGDAWYVNHYGAH